jgi:hypothetical protein
LLGRSRKSVRSKNSKSRSAKGGHSSNAPDVREPALNDREWNQLCRIVPISQKQKLHVEVYLAQFKSEREASRTSLATKRSISKLRRYATKLNAELNRLLADPVFYSAGQPSWSSKPRPKKSDFNALIAELDNVQKILEAAQARLAMSPGRKSTRPIDGLVSQLNWMLAKSGKDNVIRSNKRSASAQSSDFIRFCCKKVGLSDGQIDRAIKRNIAEYHRALEYRGIDMARDETIDGDELQSRAKRSRPRSRSML